jgi:hypothetical protein
MCQKRKEKWGRREGGREEGKKGGRNVGTKEVGREGRKDRNTI